jgi:hypothetical protein
MVTVLPVMEGYRTRLTGLSGPLKEHDAVMLAGIMVINRIVKVVER